MLFLTKLPIILPNNPPDLIILDNCALLSFISVDIFLAKTFRTLVFCHVVNNSLCDNSPS